MGRAALVDGWRRWAGLPVLSAPAVPASSPPAHITLAPQVWLFINGAWVDVSSYVLYESGIHIERGRQSESGSIDYSKLALTFKNFDPHPFTPRLPTSPYFGLLERNTPLRMSRGPIDGTVTAYLYLPGTAGTWALAPDSSALSVTGDMEVILDIALDSWRDAQDLASKYVVDGDDRSWALNIDGNGILQWVWSANGIATSNALSTIPVPAADGDRLALKVTFDVNNGAAGNDTRFWISATGAGPWTQLGATVTGAGTTSVFDSDSDVVLGDIPTSGNAPMAGKVYGFQLKNGIDGTAVANPDFTAQTEETDSFTDAAGNTWQLAAAAQFVEHVAGPWRFHGEVSEWPVTSDLTGNMVTVTIEAAGIWRRLSQNERPINSPMFRAHTHPSLTRVKAYWSCEDGAEATQIASNAVQVNGFPMLITGSPQLASSDDWTASGALPVMSGATFTGRVRGWTATGGASAYMFLFIDTAVAAETSLMYIRTSGTARTFDVRLLANGNLRLKAYDDSDVAIDDGAGNLDLELAFDLNPRGFMMIGLHMLQSGTSIKWFLTINDFANTDVATGTGLTASYLSGTITSQTFGRITSVSVGRELGLDQVILGHITVSDRTTVRLDDVGDAVNAFNGEGPATRLLRLGGEDQIPIDVAAEKAKFTGNSVQMGDQTIKTETDLLAEIEAADLGILHESRDRFALRYRTRLSLANQDPAFTLSHSSHQLADTLHPVDDDQQLANDVYVVRDRGIKAYRSKTAGKLSTKRPKLGGVGRYPAEKTISVAYDQLVEDQAGFRLLLGTVDGARYPRIEINLHHPSITGDPDLLAAILAMDIGDRVVVTDLPDYLPPDDLSVLVYGYSEDIDQFTHRMVLSCLPEAPWEWAIAEDPVKRVDTSGSETAAAFVAGTGTSLTAFTPSGALWTTRAASLPFNIRTSGVTLQVTGVASSVLDAFGRTSSNGWDNADSGQVWTATGGVASNFAVAAGVGTHTLTTTNVKRVTAFTGYADFDFCVSVAFSALATGSSLAGGLTGRFTDTSNMYYLRVEVTTANAVILQLFKFVAGVSTSLGSLTTGLTHVAGTFYRIRFQATGTSLRARVWDVAGVQEPGAWHISTTDSAFSAAASMGCVSEAFTGNTNVSPVVRFDNFEVVNPQTLTITQTPINGVVKTIPSGEAINVADPAYVGLV